MARSYNAGTKQTAGMNRANRDTKKGAPKHFMTKDSQRADVHGAATRNQVQQSY